MIAPRLLAAAGIAAVLAIALPIGAYQTQTDSAAKCPSGCVKQIQALTSQVEVLSTQLKAVTAELSTLRADLTQIGQSIPTKVVTGPPQGTDWQPKDKAQRCADKFGPGYVVVAVYNGSAHDDSRTDCALLRLER